MILTHPSSTKLSALTSCRSPQLIEEGSKNVYADLGCTDADAMQRKAMLIVRLSDAIAAHALRLDQVSAMTGVEAFCLESWLKGDVRHTDEAELHACLRHLEMQSL